jgi:hypothetical protein
MFVKAQWAAASEAAEALAQMAARGAKSDVKLAGLVRDRQDLLAEWQRRDEARTAEASTAPDKRNKQVETENLARIGVIEARIGQIDTALKEGFPEYTCTGQRGSGLKRGCAGRPAFRRGLADVLRHRRPLQAPARGNLHLGGDQGQGALAALGSGHSGIGARGGRAALRA